MKMGFIKIMDGLLCLVICFAMTGCDYIYRLLDKEGAQEKELIGEIIPNEANAVVKETQALLYLYGYNTGKIDGKLGLRTRNAIEQFQSENGIKQSRFIDQETWKRLHFFEEKQLVVKQQLNVSLVQKILKKKGFDPGAIDGKMGAKTISAITKFQEAHKLKADGKIGFQTLNKLAMFITSEPLAE